MPSKKTKLVLLYLATLAIVILMMANTAIMVFTVPHFKQIFDDFGADLPAPTQVVIGISDFFVNYWWCVTPVMLLIVACAVGGISRLYKREAPISNVINRWVVVVLMLSVIFLAVFIMLAVVTMYTPVFRQTVV
jgi:type IV pilus assembly protein PilC